LFVVLGRCKTFS